MARIWAAGVAMAMAAGAAWAQPAGSGPISAARMSAVVKEIASDAYEGRSPGTPGEAKTIDYLIGRFKALGLEPGGEKGSWTQAVPLVRFEVSDGAKMAFSLGDWSEPLVQSKEVMVQTLRPVDRVKVENAPLVFVGYGVTAPERQWDDFKGYDLKGKVAVFLVNDPDFEARPGEDAYGRFAGQAMTYYGRWTYKFEEAARRGALGAIIVHETPGAGYGWNTVQSSNSESYDIVRADPARDKTLFQGWVQRDVAADLFKRAGLDLDQLKAAARRADFHPVPIGTATFSADYGVKAQKVMSRNVIAKRTGKSRPKETVMFAAHWDAFGLGAPDDKGQRIRHGAADDGTGVAGVLELARAFVKQPRTARTTVFALWTAEERGLLGSEWYAVHPIYDPALTVANFTMDTLQPVGLSKDVVLVGAGQNELGDMLLKAAAAQHRTVTPDAHPERGLFYRADHFSMAKRGVPTLLLMSLGGGPDFVDGGRAAGDRWVSEFTAHCYHQPCDAWSPDWNLAGAAQDVDLLYRMGSTLAADGAWPKWKPASEFRGVRDATAAKRK
ncbi:M28 family metallopeptidase [Phenylobacterium soli]|uniref:Peptidase M20 n=1 Tax=Phenylobacterium soli TaxID=2170551 RepID=A0A328AJS3_9CAUL|nr:M28 family metallopeptidase [Phenylobacterium soli]RAK55203.1 peptidase M20 [Phenylobacterium soli]